MRVRERFYAFSRDDAMSPNWIHFHLRNRAATFLSDAELYSISARRTKNMRNMQDYQVAALKLRRKAEAFLRIAGRFPCESAE